MYNRILCYVEFMCGIYHYLNFKCNNNNNNNNNNENNNNNNNNNNFLFLKKYGCIIIIRAFY